jgi:formylglycine-generating enzyme required for sulfatase activity/tRNA A-37 threonylcarbamoyl transferase component Bud32
MPGKGIISINLPDSAIETPPIHSMIYWTSGQQLSDGKYIIESILGTGGFGVTYRAREQPTGQSVAIKTLNTRIQQKSDFDNYQEKFLNEALCLAKCSHPHIVKVHKVFQHQGLWCLVMEYIAGENLAQYLEERGVLSEEEALRIVRQIGEALTAVHSQGFLHRDVKPLNIILRQDTRDAVLIDFGLAREFTSGIAQTHTNQMTECFAPVEQYEKKAERGAYTDVYALAATLYVLLTAELPVPAKFRKEANIPLTPPKQHNPRISDRVSEAILKGMALQPKDRPQTVRELLKLLDPPLFKGGQGGILPTFQFEIVTANLRGEITSRRRSEAQFFAADLGGGVMLEMVAIPGDTFLMGSPKTEKGRYDNESPQHTVRVAPFFMAKYPVTQAQWKAVAAFPKIKIDLNPDPSWFKGANRPVEQVNWHEAVEFCARLAKKTGKTYRLPSEAEWEYACRGCTGEDACTTPFYFGETITPDLANYNGSNTYASEPKGIYRQQTTDVGSFPPNAFGLYDMHGNVWEWCADPWHGNYIGAPADGSVWESGGNQDLRVLRGGSWLYSAVNCRCARRLRVSAGYRYGDLGFRVAGASLLVAS